MEPTTHHILDDALGLIRRGRVAEGIDRLMGDLNRIRSTQGRRETAAAERSALLRHAVTELVHQDPLTYHAFAKPRGYPGDAELLDHIYREIEPEELSEVGRVVNGYCLETGASRSVRARREIVARAIDETAARVDGATIVSIACGHLREAALSSALRAGTIGELIAIDQDETSLAEIRRAYPGAPVRTVAASVRQILTNRATLPPCDLIYSAGLYDYLALPTARRLTARMFAALKPGGRILLANFAPDLRERGYMETFMDWHLIYRDEEEMMRVIDEIAEGEIREVRTYRDGPGNLVFLEGWRAG